jgi:hypothetical protein
MKPPFDDRSVGAIVQRPIMDPFPEYWFVGRGPSENKQRVVSRSTWILAGVGPPLRRHGGVVKCLTNKCEGAENSRIVSGAVVLVEFVITRVVISLCALGHSD